MADAIGCHFEGIKKEAHDELAGTAFQSWLLDNLDLFSAEDLVNTPPISSHPISHGSPSWGSGSVPAPPRAPLHYAANSLPAALEPRRSSLLRLQAGGSLQLVHGRAIKQELCPSQSAPMPDAGRASGRMGKQPIMPKPKRYTSKAQKEAHQRFRDKKRTELVTLEQEVQDKLALLQQLEAENAQLRSRSRVLAASVDCSQETLGLLHDLQQLRLTDAVQSDQGSDASGWLEPPAAVFSSNLAQQRGSGMVTSPPEDSYTCLFSGDSVSSLSTATEWSGALDLPAGAGAAIWGTLGQRTAVQRSEELLAGEPAGMDSAMWGSLGPQQQHTAAQRSGAMVVEGLEVLLPSRPCQQWGSAELMLPQRSVQLFRDAADALHTYQCYIADASEALRHAEEDPHTLAQLENQTASMLRRFRMWFLSGKDALEALYSYKQRNLETGKEAEPGHGFWEHVLELLELHPDQEQDLLSCKSMFAMAASKTAGARRELAAQLVAALPVHPNNDDEQTAGGGDLCWSELGVGQAEDMACTGNGAPADGEAAACQRAAAAWNGSLAHIQQLLAQTQSNLTRACILDRLFNMAVMRVLTPLQVVKSLVNAYPFLPCYHSIIAALAADLQLRQEQGLQQQ